ncbi:MAG: hypothetical protein ACE5IY_10845 [bacterium]
MPVYKYRSLREAEEALWCLNPDQQYYDQLGMLWEFAQNLNPVSYPRGVFKFKTMEEANKHMDDLILEHALEKQKTMNIVDPAAGKLKQKPGK